MAGTTINSGSVGTGITLTSGEILSNTSTGTITGPTYGVFGGPGGTYIVINAGSIGGGTASGVRLSAGGAITNQTGGIIAATGGTAVTAVWISGAAGTVVNQSSITATSHGIYLSAGGSATNQSGGVINAGGYGASIEGGGSFTNQSGGTINAVRGMFFNTGTGAAVNQGLISASSTGIYLDAGGSVTNQAGGSITAVTGILLNGNGSVTNQSGGTIAASGDGISFFANVGVRTAVNQGLIVAGNQGIVLDGGGFATNEASGSITGASVGIAVNSGGGTLENAGTIVATGVGAPAIRFAAGYANLLKIDPGASFTGVVQGANTVGATAVSTLELASGAAAGTLSGFGTAFVDFARITVDPGAAWVLAGTQTLASGVTLTDNGALTNTGSLTVYGSLHDDGLLTNSAGISGVVLLSGGTLVNAQGATIAGLPMAAYGASGGSAGTVVNAGLLVSGGDTKSGGVGLLSGGFVSNATSGTIAGGGVGIYINNAADTSANGGTVLNYGSVGGIGTHANGVEIDAGGLVSNAAGGTITGTNNGVLIGVASTSQSALVVNQGIIATGTTGAAGVYLQRGGTVTNAASASILGATSGVDISGGAGTLVNAGSIAGTGTAGRGVELLAGGLVTNAGTGTISGAGSNGVYVNGGAGTVLNAGIITAAGGARPAVALFQGGYVGNAGTGTISGAVAVSVYITGTAGTVVNAGQIFSGGTRTAVVLKRGGSVTNQSGGTIAGTPLRNGVYISGLAGTVTNYGLVIQGVNLAAGGTVANHAGGTISASDIAGLIGQNTAIQVINAGLIMSTGTNSGGIGLHAGGYIDNQQGGTIDSAHSVGIYLNGGAGTVVNSGTITGAFNSLGINLVSNGTVTNTNSGVITGGNGILLNAGGTLTNAGTIVGIGGVAVVFGGTSSNLLMLDPGYGFFGVVIGSTSASNTLELASAASAGTLSGIGTEFLNFGSIAFDTGADWFISGSTAGLGGTISGFAAADTIEVTGITVTGSSYAGGVLTLMEASGSFELNLPGSFATSDFFVTNVAAGTDITVICFRAGTRIRTPHGETPVESLRVGGTVLARAGDGRMVPRPIAWIGHRSVDCRRHPKRKLVWPVKIVAGAFGPGHPATDLFLSPDHAVFIDGVLIPAKHLIDGASIVQVPLDEVTYFHVELPQHAVLFAEGLPVESYLDTGDRSSFVNGGGPMRLHPDFSTVTWEALGCAPLIVTGPRLDAVRARLAADRRLVA